MDQPSLAPQPMRPRVSMHQQSMASQHMDQQSMGSHNINHRSPPSMPEMHSHDMAPILPPYYGLYSPQRMNMDPNQQQNYPEHSQQ